MRLDGIRVLDLTRLLPGPYATQLLADMGADVVKVERPGVGDYARAMDAAREGSLFDAVNRGKRSVTLDLKAEEGREAFLALAADADAVIEGFRPGVVDRLGVDYEAVRERNESVVYCSLSGFGGTGPLRNRAGHDLNYVGMAGLLDMTRASRPGADSRPAIPGFPIADMAGGLFAAFSILGGLLSRELGGGGEYVDVAMTDVVLSFSQAVSTEAFAGGDPRGRETALTGRYPCYDIYETADGRYVTLAALEPAFWQAFCEAIDRPELAADHFADDPQTRERVRTAVADAIRERTRDEWEDTLGDEDVMVAPVLTMVEALDHPHVEARGLVDRGADADGAGDGPSRIGFPARTEGGLGDTDDSVPGLGEHTDAVLREAGYSREEIDVLRDADAV